MQTYYNAPSAARRALNQCGDHYPTQADFDFAAAEWIRSYIRDDDIGALVEFVCEQPDNRILNLFGAVANALEHSSDETYKRVGQYLTEISADYIASPVEDLRQGEAA